MVHQLPPNTNATTTSGFAAIIDSNDAGTERPSKVLERRCSGWVQTLNLVVLNHRLLSSNFQFLAKNQIQS